MFAYMRKIYQNKTKKVDESLVFHGNIQGQFKHVTHISGDLCGYRPLERQTEEQEVTQQAECGMRLASVWLREAGESKGVTDLWSSP